MQKNNKPFHKEEEYLKKAISNINSKFHLIGSKIDNPYSIPCFKLSTGALDIINNTSFNNIPVFLPDSVNMFFLEIPITLDYEEGEIEIDKIFVVNFIYEDRGYLCVLAFKEDHDPFLRAIFDSQEQIKKDKIFIPLLCKILQYIEYPEVEVVTHERTLSRQNKKNSFQLINLKVLKPTGKLKRHIDTIKQKKEHNTRKGIKTIFVTGHLHGFRNKNYFSTLYDNYSKGKIGTEQGYYLINEILRRWIFPYVKGQELENG